MSAWEEEDFLGRQHLSPLPSSSGKGGSRRSILEQTVWRTNRCRSPKRGTKINPDSALELNHGEGEV
jgi:hypothetical protein